MKILVLSQDISLLNIVDYILYKDYKIIKSTSFENLDVELNSFDLVIIDLPYWEKNSNIRIVLKEYPVIPLIVLTEDKSSDIISTLKNEFYVKAVLKEPLSKKELKETVKDLSKKKKQKKDKDKSENKNENYFSTPLNDLVSAGDTVFFRITDLQEKRIEYISDNYKNFFNINDGLSNLKDISDGNEIPFISPSAPEYSLIYKLKNNPSQIVKETGKGDFDANKYLNSIEGTITDYTNEYIKENLISFLNSILASEYTKNDTTEFVKNIIHKFSQDFSKEHLQLSIIFLNKDFFAPDFTTTDFSVSSEIISPERKLGEVILFSNNHDLDDSLKSISQILAGIIYTNHSTSQIESKYSSEISRLRQDLTLVSNQFTQAETAFQDKARSYDNLNELFSAAMKDYKNLSSKFNRAAVVFETNADGKFLTANENYYRATSSDKANFVGKYFDDIFDNTSWQNFQFEFFNNSNQEISLKQKNKEGKVSYFSFHVAREESDSGYKFIFYGRDKTEPKSLELELSKQISEYNAKVNEIIDTKKESELLWAEINALKSELKDKDAIIKRQEKEILKAKETKKEITEELIISKNEQEEYKLENEESEITFKEDVEQKIEEAKEKINEQEKVQEQVKDENAEQFKNLRGIDFKVGLANAYDNIDTYNEILVNFENDYSEFVKDIKGMYLVNDNEYIKSRLLTLGEESKYIGAEDLEKSAHLFHDKINENKVNNFDFELSVLGVHLSFTLESIRKYKDEYSLLEPKQSVESESNEHGIIFHSKVSEEPLKGKQEIVQEEIVEENKSIEEVIQERVHHESPAPEKPNKQDDEFTLLLKDMKKSLERPEDISLIREKLFKLKFQNSDFNRIEKLESLEASVESGNHSASSNILDALINS